MEPSRLEKAQAIARIANSKDGAVLLEWMNTNFDALKNELENPDNQKIQFTQGQVATFRNILNFIAEKTKESK